MIKVFTTNKDGKIELEKDELKKILDEAYWEGYNSNRHTYIYNTPSWSPYTFTADTINASDTASNTITINSNVN